MPGGFLPNCVLAVLLLICFSFATDVPAEERMPLWDRIALSDVSIYTSESREQGESLPPVKKGTWARFIRHSEKFSTELVELESGGKYWIQDHSMYPLYYVVGTSDLVVQVPHGSSAKPVDPTAWSEEVIVHPGDVVAVDRWGQALSGTWVIYTPDGSKHGYAPINRLQPVGDAGMGLAGD